MFCGDYGVNSKKTKTIIEHSNILYLFHQQSTQSTKRNKIVIDTCLDNLKWVDNSFWNCLDKKCQINYFKRPKKATILFQEYFPYPAPNLMYCSPCRFPSPSANGFNSFGGIIPSIVTSLLPSSHFKSFVARSHWYVDMQLLKHQDPEMDSKRKTLVICWTQLAERRQSIMPNILL